MRFVGDPRRFVDSVRAYFLPVDGWTLVAGFLPPKAGLTALGEVETALEGETDFAPPSPAPSFLGRLCDGVGGALFGVRSTGLS